MLINSRNIKQLAREVGFSDCGIAAVAPLSEDEYPLAEWLQNGWHADMDYMEHNVQMRYDPRLLLDGAKSVISLLFAYKPDCLMESKVRISQYAYGEDYHELMKRMMYQLMAKIKELYPDFEARAFVDTAPISDRHWAVRAGLGWIGKNTLFFHPLYGSMCYIGELVTPCEADCCDSPRVNVSPCEGCSLCVDACPNHAIVQYDGRFHIDARRCTSYNTIENRADSLPAGLDTRGYAFGCDICQSVCPVNHRAPASLCIGPQRMDELESLADADEAAFRRFSKHSALNRIKYRQWRRNMVKSEGE